MKRLCEKIVQKDCANSGIEMRKQSCKPCHSTVRSTPDDPSLSWSYFRFHLNINDISVEEEDVGGHLIINEISVEEEDVDVALALRVINAEWGSKGDKC